jgi:outer membrane protein assembly factor BamB
VPDAASGALKPIWVKPVEPYISQKVQIIAASGRLFLSTARGLYAFDAATVADLWVYPTELPLGHSPTYADGRVYVGGLDRRIHAIDADTGQALWTFGAAGGFHTSPLVVEGLVCAGSRDGCMYAVDAGTGELVWKQNRGQILQSAAFRTASSSLVLKTHGPMPYARTGHRSGGRTSCPAWAGTPGGR